MLGIYVRRSKEDESNSIDNQIREGEEFADKKGIKCKVYNEGMGFSGGLTLKDRPKLQELFDDVESGIITNVWMRNQERLERNTEVFFEFTELAIDYDLSVYMSGSKVDYTNPSNFLSGGIISMVNTYTRKKQSRDTKKSIRDNFKVGLVHGIPSYGYMTEPDTRKMIQDPEQAETVKLIFKMSLEGHGFEAIASELNRLNKPTRYNLFADRLINHPDYDIERYKKYKKYKWVGGSVQNIINNEIYKGVRRIWKKDKNGKRIKTDETYTIDDPILEPFYYDKVVRHLPKNMNNSGKKVYHKYLLNGACTCGVCGKPFNGRTVEVGAKYTYYQCVTKKHGKNSCGNLMVRLPAMDSLIWDIYFKNKRMLDILDVDFSRKGIMNEMLKTAKKIKQLKASKDEVIANQDKVLDAVEQGSLKPHQIKARMAKYDEQLLTIDEDVFDTTRILEQHAQTLESSLRRFDDFDGMENITDFNEKQAIINKYIKNIKVTKTGKNHALLELEYFAPNVFPDALVIDRLYHWYALPNMMNVESLSDKEIPPKKEEAILKDIYETYSY